MTRAELQELLQENRKEIISHMENRLSGFCNDLVRQMTNKIGSLHLAGGATGHQLQISDQPTNQPLELET